MWPLHLSVAHASAPRLSLQKLVVAWRNQAQRHALVTAPEVLVAQVGRFGDDGCKLQFRIQSSRTVYIPSFTGSGLHTTSHAYTVEAIVFHLGPSRDSGHYRTALLQQGNLYRLTDDGSLPAAVQDTDVAVVEHNAYLYFLRKHHSLE